MNIREQINLAERKCAPVFAEIEQVALANTERMLDLFHEHRVAAQHFNPTTGYGYGDIGRDKVRRNTVADALRLLLEWLGERAVA